MQAQSGKPERQLVAFEQTLAEQANSSRREFTPEEMSRLLTFNRRLTELELYLRELGQRESARLDAVVLDTQDPMDDYEIEAKLQYILREDDPDFDENEDNILTERTYHLKIDSSLADGENHREPLAQYPGLLNEESHCWLFHDLYDHCYNDLHPALDFHEILRIGSIWIDVAVRHQSIFDIETGQWQAPSNRVIGAIAKRGHSDSTSAIFE